MENWLITKALKFLGGQLDGYKTKIGGVGLILVGILGLLRIAFPDQIQLPNQDIGTSLGEIFAGFTALGVGHKAEKLTEAVNSQTAQAVVTAQVAKDESKAEAVAIVASVDKVTEICK